MRVMSLVGARPQFIKEAIIHRELSKAGIIEILVNSGQHYDHNMSGVFFDDFKIKSPDYNLGIGSASHAEMTGRIIIEFEKVITNERPDWLLVFGDTNTTLAGAIVASKLSIPIAHVEAGIRMLPKSMPEEINRVLTDRVSKLLFCASERSVENLNREGIQEGVYFTGDVMYDLFLETMPAFRYEMLCKLGLEAGDYAVLTMHRDYNVDSKQRLEQLLAQLDKLAPALPIVFPIHPRTKSRVKEFGLERLIAKLAVVEPLDYLNLMGLVSKSRLVITDSGGLQKESYYAGKPAVLLMHDPAWHELVEEGINILSGDGDLSSLCKNLPTSEFRRGIYGDGNASRRITEILASAGR